LWGQARHDIADPGGHARYRDPSPRLRLHLFPIRRPSSTTGRHGQHAILRFHEQDLVFGGLQAAVEGRLPRGIGVARLRVARLRDAPAEWSRQYAMLGLSISDLARRCPAGITRTYGTDQCAPSSALKLVIPESNDPVIAVVASAPRGKSIFVIEPRKIAAIGRAATK
jgi:hypothetical protein